MSAKHREEQSRTVTEDDVNEVKGEISTMRYEILEVLEKNGMDVSCAERKEKSIHFKSCLAWTYFHYPLFIFSGSCKTNENMGAKVDERLPSSTCRYGC